MTLIQSAWQARQNSLQALLEGRIEQALGWATESQALHATPAGHRMRLLAAWLLQKTGR